VCDQAAADRGVQQEMNICAQHEFLAADEALNAQWRITRKYMRQRDRQWTQGDAHNWDERPGYFDTLLAAQRAWLIYRDEHCRAEGYGARGGSLEPLLISACKTGLTRIRTGQLRDLAEYPG
jgi:uncharacterized protein YecT (DUF1311 family)